MVNIFSATKKEKRSRDFYSRSAFLYTRLSFCADRPPKPWSIL
ncbi:hypothetical protein HMPREF0083_01420 [Aneurinibacillus aneurinilyticus ATCC 12856]|uniref:Uncharacterized protein n=1 Tax=Aneurinibacillus aneurinilyticus ATCC 12856 TaxID=649747 RepID=U1WPI1_ANEAE|nr:hypothetical protein HMPREF0083_01420 [Aneurinibacillus aneurinilyticus ATCC 12856]